MSGAHAGVADESRASLPAETFPARDFHGGEIHPVPGLLKVWAEPEPGGPRLGEPPRSAPPQEQRREGAFPQTEVPGA